MIKFTGARKRLFAYKEDGLDILKIRSKMSRTSTSCVYNVLSDCVVTKDKVNCATVFETYSRCKVLINTDDVIDDSKVVFECEEKLYLSPSFLGATCNVVQCNTPVDILLLPFNDESDIERQVDRNVSNSGMYVDRAVNVVQIDEYPIALESFTVLEQVVVSDACTNTASFCYC